MIEIQRFSRYAGLFKMDHALGVLLTRALDQTEDEAVAADFAAFEQDFVPWVEKHHKYCKDLIFVINDGEDAVPHARAFFRKVFGEARFGPVLKRLKIKLECPKMSASAGLELARRLKERDF